MHANATLRQYLANSNAHFENSPRILILILAQAIRKIYQGPQNKNGRNYAKCLLHLLHNNFRMETGIRRLTQNRGSRSSWHTQRKKNMKKCHFVEIKDPK